MGNVFWLVIIGYGVYYYFNKNKKLTPEEIEAQRKLQEEADLKEKERLLQLKKQREAFMDEVESKNERIYFSYCFVGENSPIYLVFGDNNAVIEESRTTLKELYSQGFLLFQADKTGQSAQMEDFNFLIHVKRIAK